MRRFFYRQNESYFLTFFLTVGFFLATFLVAQQQPQAIKLKN